MRFKLNLTCDNDAFEPTDAECDGEVARILRELADRVERGELDLPVGMRVNTKVLHDINGNDVGRATYERTGRQYK